MNEDEAYDILGLPHTATPAEINARLRELASQKHPDRGGDNEAMAKLTNARDIALKAAAKKRSIDPTKEFTRINTEIDRRMGQQEVTKELAKKIIHKHTKRLRKITWTTIAIAIVSLTITLLGTNIIILFEIPGIITNTAAALTAISILTYFFTSSKAGEIKEEVKEIREILDFRPTYLALINVIKLNFLPPPPWTQQNLEAIINTWITSSTAEPQRIRKIAEKIGKTDFTSLILSKGIEYGVFRAHETEINGKTVIGYSLRGNDR